MTISSGLILLVKVHSWTSNCTPLVVLVCVWPLDGYRTLGRHEGDVEMMGYDADGFGRTSDS
jgi:hypothetical protein